MMRLPLLLACLLLVGLPITGHSQTPLRDKIRAGAQTQADNMLKGDYAKLVDAMYPPVVEMIGGREAMLKVVSDGLVEMKAQGFKIDKAEVGQASDPVAGGDKLFAIVPQTVHITGPKMVADQEGYLLAVSTDKGETWYYFDGAALNSEAVRRFFPDFPETLKLPERRQPKITPVS